MPSEMGEDHLTMPIKKGKDCFGDVMGEFKRGQLHSGKKGPVVKSRQQAQAIAASQCFADCECGGKCDRCKKKSSMMALGYSETAAELIAQQSYPTVSFSENEVIGMVRSRLSAMHAKLSQIEQALEMAMMSGGEVEMSAWMVDKITLANDYLTSVADNAMYGDGIEVEMEDEEEEEGEGEGEGEGEYTLGQLDRVYGEKKGLWDNINAKRERIKRGSGERMRKPGEKGAPSAADLKAASADDKDKK